MKHEPIMWTQLAASTVTTRLHDLTPGGLGCYETTVRTDRGVVCRYATGDEGRARRAHRILARRVGRLEGAKGIAA